MGDERRPLVLRWRTAVLNSAEPPSTKLTLLALGEHANPAGRDCYPSVDTLARQTSLAEKTCRLALDSVDGRWFTRTPKKLAGRAWRGYDYALCIPEGAVTVTGPRREVAVTMTGPKDASCGEIEHELRSLTARAAVTMTDDLGKAPRKSTKGTKPKSAKKTYREWAASVGDDEKMIPGDHHVFAYAERVGLPVDFLELCWHAFQHRYRDDDKARYSDWPTHFRKAAEGNWYRLWYIDGDGNYQLTTPGKQADIYHQTGIQAHSGGDAFTQAI